MLGTLEQQSQQDSQRRLGSAQSIYGGGLDELRNTTPTDYSGITSQMNSALSGLAPNFGGQAYQAPGEGAAGNALGLAYGEAGNTMLSGMAAREGQHQASSERQMGLMGTYAQDRIHQDQEDSLQQYRNQLQNLRANDPYQIAQEATRLEDQSVSNKGMMSQIRSDREFSEYLQNMLGNQIGGPTSGGGGGGGGGNGGGGNGGPQNPGGNAGNFPAQGGYGDTAAGGNSFGSPPSSYPRNAIRNIRGEDYYGQLPQWLQELYDNNQGPERWNALDNRRQRQIFRQTRPHVQGLYDEFYG